MAFADTQAHYETMTSAELETLRAAFEMDRKNLKVDSAAGRGVLIDGADDVGERFVDGRLALIENILGRRHAH